MPLFPTEMNQEEIRAFGQAQAYISSRLNFTPHGKDLRFDAVELRIPNHVLEGALIYAMTLKNNFKERIESLIRFEGEHPKRLAAARGIDDYFARIHKAALGGESRGLLDWTLIPINAREGIRIVVQTLEDFVDNAWRTRVIGYGAPPHHIRGDIEAAARRGVIRRTAVTLRGTRGQSNNVFLTKLLYLIDIATEPKEIENCLAAYDEWLKRGPVSGSL